MTGYLFFTRLSTLALRGWVICLLLAVILFFSVSVGGNAASAFFAVGLFYIAGCTFLFWAVTHLLAKLLAPPTETEAKALGIKRPGEPTNSNWDTTRNS